MLPCIHGSLQGTAAFYKLAGRCTAGRVVIFLKLVMASKTAKAPTMEPSAAPAQPAEPGMLDLPVGSAADI